LVEEFSEKGLESPVFTPWEFDIPTLLNDNGTAVDGNTKYVHM
jgi:hypothetical protein